MSKRNLEVESAILRRLDCLILLELEQGEAPSKSVTEKVEKLAGFGLTNGEIAEILGKPLNYVTATRSQARRRGVKRKAGNG